MSAARRLARCIYSDALVCVCGKVLQFRFMAAVGEPMRDCYSLPLECERCKSLWVVALTPKDYPHVRVRRVGVAP